MKAKENAIKTSEARRKPGNVELQVQATKCLITTTTTKATKAK